MVGSEPSSSESSSSLPLELSDSSESSSDELSGLAGAAFFLGTGFTLSSDEES